MHQKNKEFPLCIQQSLLCSLSASTFVGLVGLLHSLPSPGQFPQTKNDWISAACHSDILHFTHPKGNTFIWALHFKESLFYWASSESSAQLWLLLFLCFCCVAILCWSSAEHPRQPLSHWGTPNWQKEGTKMKLLKQQQPQVTELLLPNTNTVSQQTLPTHEPRPQGSEKPRACGQDKHSVDQEQTNTAQLHGALRTGPGSIRKSHWNTSSAAQNPFGTSWWDGRLCVGHVVHSASTMPQLHSSAEKLLLLPVGEDFLNGSEAVINRGTAHDAQHNLQ